MREVLLRWPALLKAVQGKGALRLPKLLLCS